MIPKPGSDQSRYVAGLSVAPLLAALAVCQVGLLVAVGVPSSAGLLYCVLFPIANAAPLAWVVATVCIC